jgi:hypothetical protein
LPDVRMLLGGIGGGIGTLDYLDAPLPGADRLCGAQSLVEGIGEDGIDEGKGVNFLCVSGLPDGRFPRPRRGTRRWSAPSRCWVSRRKSAFPT